MSLWVGSSMAKAGIFAKSEAETVFHPWWTTLQDYLVYALILVGLFALPTVTDILDCTTVYANQTSPAHSSFVNKYCTRENLSLYVSYFPYIIAVGPILVILIEKFFLNANSGGMKMQRFYALLVEDIINTDDLFQIHRQSRRDIKELRNEFRFSKSFLLGFVTKIILELLCAIGFAVWLIIASWDNIFELKEGGKFHIISFETCDLVGVDFTCIVPNTHFYFSLLIATLALVLLYVLCALYTLIWVVFKGVRKLSRYLVEYRQSVTRQSIKQKWDKERSTQALDVYGGLHSPDVELLLDLLAETMGVASSMRILTILDQEFHTAWRTTQVMKEDEVGSNQVIVTFEGATMGRYLGRYAQNKLMYVATICPQDTVDEVKSLNHEPDEILRDQDAAEGRPPMKKNYQIAFEGLNAGSTYKVTIATTFNGKEVAENYIEIKTRPIPPTNLAVEWGFDVHERSIFFKAAIRWTPIVNEDCTYFIEILEENLSLNHETRESRFEHFTEGQRTIVVKVWSVLDGMLKSEDCLESQLPPVPELLRDYVRHLSGIMPPEAIGSKYLFQVELLKHISHDLRDLYGNMKGALTTSVRSYDAKSIPDDDSLEKEFIGREPTVANDLAPIETE